MKSAPARLDVAAHGVQVALAREPERDLSWLDASGQASRAEHDGEEDRVERVTAAVQRTCRRPRGDAVPLADGGEFDELVLDPLRQVHQPAGRRTVRQRGVGPQMLEHSHQVRLTASVEAGHPHRRLSRAAAVADVGVEDALKTVLVLALADEAREFVLQNLPLVRVVRPVHVGDTVVRDLEVQRPTGEEFVVDGHAMSFCGSITRAR